MKHEEILQQHLPDAFQQAEMPSGWAEDWILIPVPAGEFEVTESTLAQLEDFPEKFDPIFAGSEGGWNLPPGLVDPSYGEGGSVQTHAGGLGPLVGATHPGAPVIGTSSGPNCIPPPDANAFYLPFHYYPKWWGIYLFPDGVKQIARQVQALDSHTLPPFYYFASARFFLYAHEFYHHRIESLASRLEVSHRSPAYRTGFQVFYDAHRGTDRWLEEGLANAYALQRIKKCFSKIPSVRDRLLNAYCDLLRAGPAGYRMGCEWQFPKAFKEQESKLAEESLVASFLALPQFSPQIWETGSFLTRGFGTIKSRIHYLIPKGAPLPARTPLTI